MITDSFRKNGISITSPGSFGQKGRVLCEYCIVTFSKKIYDYVLDKYNPTKVAFLRSCSGDFPVYIINHKGKNIGFFLTNVGSATCANNILDLNWVIGARKFVMFGSCGTLDSEKTKSGFIIPDYAYRDEGISYHYAEPSDYIKIKNFETVKTIFSEYGIPFDTGRVWTTDAILRETYEEREERLSEGCTCVDMELSGVQAVCDFHNLELYYYFQSGDVLTSEGHVFKELQNANHDTLKFDVALLIIDYLSSKDEILTHYMRLNKVPFEQIKNGKKTIELRLNDEKRQKVGLGDKIIFTNTECEEEKLVTQVINIYKFGDFEQLFSSLDLKKCGYKENEHPSIDDMKAYYSDEQLKKYGALGIEIKLI